MNSFSFACLGNFLTFLNGNLAEKSILGCRFRFVLFLFFFQHFEIPCHFVLAYKLCVEKSNNSLVGFPCMWLVFFFFLAAFKILSLNFLLLIMSWCASLCWSYLRLSLLSVPGWVSFPGYRFSLNKFSVPLCLPLLTPYNENIGMFDVSLRSLEVFSFKKQLFLLLVSWLGGFHLFCLRNFVIHSSVII